MMCCRYLPCLILAGILGCQPAQLRAQVYLPDAPTDALPVTASAELPDPAIIALPACAEQGQWRVALSVPPGRSREEFEASVEESQIFPSGTRIFIFPPGSGPKLLNREEMSFRSGVLLQKLFAEGMTIQGLLVVLLQIDADGQVQGVSSNAGNEELNEALGQLWRRASFEPFAYGGCRALTWYHVPISFASGVSAEENRMEMKVGEQSEAPEK